MCERERTNVVVERDDDEEDEVIWCCVCDAAVSMGVCVRFLVLRWAAL